MLKSKAEWATTLLCENLKNGNTTKSNNTLNNPYQYNAEYTDSSTGLQYLRARYYDSSQGRFTTKDTYLGTIPNPLSRNLYTYVENNPLNYIDPSGHVKVGKSIGAPISALKKNVADAASIAKKTATVASKGANYVAVANSPTATNAAKAKAKATYLQSKAGLAVALAMKKACSVADRINIKGINNQSVLDNFRDDFRAETGLDIYAIGNLVLSTAGAFGSAGGFWLGILAAPETGGASLVLTAFSTASLAFACSDAVEYWNEINVGKTGEYKYGTSSRANNWLYDDVFKGNDTAYNNVRMFADLGTIIFSLGTSYTVAMANKSPANVIKNVASKNKTVLPNTSSRGVANPYELQPTHSQTLSNKKMNELINDIKVNGIKEPIKYVEYEGKMYVVDGHHRLIAAKRLGLSEVPIEEVNLPYAGYKTVDDLLWFD